MALPSLTLSMGSVSISLESFANVEFSVKKLIIELMNVEMIAMVRLDLGLKILLVTKHKFELYRWSSSLLKGTCKAVL